MVHTPASIFPSLWEKLDQYISSEKIIIIDQIKEECINRNNELKDWFGNYNSKILETLKDTEILIETKRIMNQFSNIIDPLSPRDQADPYIVATANIKDLTVVTEEAFKHSKINIPYICQQLDIECIKVKDFYKQENWRF